MIKYWDYREAYARDRVRILNAVDEVFSSGRLILGAAVDRFERNFSAYCEGAYGVGVNSGTDALFLALKALEIGPDDEVVTVANTAVPTVAAVRATGATPVFVDVQEDTFLMEPSLLAEVLTERTKCIIPVHLLGQPVDMDPVLRAAGRRGIPVVEDCAQAAGALYKGRRVGSLGVLGAFSFYPTKVLGGYGDGGMVVTGDAGLARRLRRLRFYGMDAAYYSEEEGFNSRLDEVQAAILDLKLQSLEADAQARVRLAQRYAEGLAGAGDLALPAAHSDRTHRFYAFTIRTSRRDELQNYLREQEIESKVNYPAPVHLMRGYAFLGYRPGHLPVTERLAGEILSLPLYPGLPDDSVDRVIDAVRRFFRTRGGR